MCKCNGILNLNMNLRHLCYTKAYLRRKIEIYVLQKHKLMLPAVIKKYTCAMITIRQAINTSNQERCKFIRARRSAPPILVLASGVRLVRLPLGNSIPCAEIRCIPRSGTPWRSLLEVETTSSPAASLRPCARWPSSSTAPRSAPVLWAFSAWRLSDDLSTHSI